MRMKESIFTHPSQLNSISAVPFARTGAMGTLRLGGSIAEDPRARRWEVELNKHYRACGCDTGAKGLILALLAGGVWAGFAYSKGEWGAGLAIGVTIGLAVAGAIMGKLIGLIRANARLRQTIRQIQAEWKVEQPPEQQLWICG